MVPLRRLAVAVAVLVLAAAPAAAAPLQDPAPPAPQPAVPVPPLMDPPIEWQHSIAVGLPFAGRLVGGVQLPAEGRDFFTYDWGTRQIPNRGWRRWGTDRLVHTLLDVLASYRDAHVLYPRVDGAEKRAWRPGLVDRALAQDLVDRFVAAGAVYVFTGPSLHLRGPHKVVVALVHHDDHLHVRVR